MGSGNHRRTWLNKTVRGTLVELPLAWYAENGGHWDLNPWHDRPYALPPGTVAYECIRCHNANPKIPAGHAAPGSEAVYSGTPLEGIDCQYCHGKEFEQAIRLRPDFGLAHPNAAAILAGKGDFIGAREHLQKAAKHTDPNIRQRALRQLRWAGGRQAVPPAILSPASPRGTRLSTLSVPK
jgi:hypothetical protein